MRPLFTVIMGIVVIAVVAASMYAVIILAWILAIAFVVILSIWALREAWREARRQQKKGP